MATVDERYDQVEGVTDRIITAFQSLETLKANGVEINHGEEYRKLVKSASKIFAHGRAITRNIGCSLYMSHIVIMNRDANVFLQGIRDLTDRMARDNRELAELEKNNQ